MLDPWIIEEIRRREEEQRRRDDRQPAVIELPIHQPTRHDDERAKPDDKKDAPRGIAIIELL